MSFDIVSSGTRNVTRFRDMVLRERNVRIADLLMLHEEARPGFDIFLLSLGSYVESE